LSVPRVSGRLLELLMGLLRWGIGWCWWYRKYAPGDTVLELLEHEAREGRKGV